MIGILIPKGFGFQPQKKSVYYVNITLQLDYESMDFPNTIWYNKGTRDLLISIAMFLPVSLIGLIGE